MRKIDRVFCWIATAPNGDEGVPVIPDACAAFGSKRELIESFAPFLRDVYQPQGCRLRLVMFSGLREVDEQVDVPPPAPPGPKQIGRLWAYLATEPDGDGIAGMMDPDGVWMPLVAADRDRYEYLRPQVAMLRRMMRVPIRLVCFNELTELGGLTLDA
jgi:hypothetical protein